jgi:pimeloyl-ACP methyl ester carboxylesterase
VLYAHGYVSTNEPVALPAEGDFIIGLLAPQGFAVAFSSYSVNGWAVGEGTRDTHQLLSIFTRTFGAPVRVYVAGASMGGLIAIKLAETYPYAFDGVLPTCAVAGGARRLFDYYSHVRALFDVFYPGVLPGDAGHVPSPQDVTQAIVAPAVAAMTANPAGALAMSRIDQIPLPFASPAELFESIVTALPWHAGTFADLIDRTQGHPFFDNQYTRYTGSLPRDQLNAINAATQRFRGSADGEAYLKRHYEPSGRLQVPMVSLSMTRDPVVPGFNQTSYQSRVEENGRDAFLIARAIDRYGHCVFAPQELGAAFAALVGWVEFGVPPTP